MKKFKLKTHYKKILADTISPVSVYLKIRDKFPNSILLESSDYHGNDNSFSYICCNPIASIKVDANLVTKTYPDHTVESKFVESDKVTLEIDAFTKQFETQKNKEFKINNAEKIILEKMINNPGKTFSREDIGKLIDLDKERSIDVIITRLRKKIEIDPKNPKYLQTLRGVGYVLWIE